MPLAGVLMSFCGLCFNAAQPRGEMQQPYRTRPNSVQYTRRKQRNVMVECMYYQHPTEQIAIYEQIKQPKVSNATTSIEISLSREIGRGQGKIDVPPTNVRCPSIRTTTTTR